MTSAKHSSIKIILIIVSFAFGKLNAQNVPQGFIDQVHSSSWNVVTGFTFDKNNNMYVYDKKGRVYIIDSNGIQLQQPLIDLSDEVGNFGDNGLLGFCLHPDFLNNGYIYLFYTVDRYHLLNAGSPTYDSTQSLYNEATICRVTRYTANASDSMHSVIPSSRNVLLGDKKTNGIPLLFIGHSGGQIAFGRDTSLIISTGDGASFSLLDSGNTTATYWAQALNDSIIRPAENVGAFRSLMMNSLCGKILRIDPATGLGLSTNPFYEPLNPDSAVSKIWALGLRNPFRFTMVPNTGSVDILAGDPGIIYAGDVGWNTWESIHIIKQGGHNSGWPVFEGLTEENQYLATHQINRDAINPLFAQGKCADKFFRFSDLTVLDRNWGNPAITNPCDTTLSIPSNCYPMVHIRPAIEWRHTQSVTRSPVYTAQGNPISVSIDQPNASVHGTVFTGSASVGGCFYNDNRMPLLYQNCYYHADYVAGWIKRFTVDSNYNITNVDSFASNLGAVVFLTVNPQTGCLMYVKYPNEIHTICYTGNLNNPPKAVAESDTCYTVNNNLTVQFNGSNSTDPENKPLHYDWDFGDASAHDTIANPAHTYSTPLTSPEIFTATLTVTDDTLQTATDNLKIHLNNSPPDVIITSPAPGYLFPFHILSLLQLTAIVSDAQTPNPLLSYQWQMVFHHSIHQHPDMADTTLSPTVIITPVGCDSIIEMFYRIHLTVTDPQGLKGHVYTDIYADCASAFYDLTGENALISAVFPNPVENENFNVAVKTKEPTNNNLEIFIYDITGRMIYQNTYSNALQSGSILIPMQVNLSSGIYHLKVSDGVNFCHFKFTK